LPVSLAPNQPHHYTATPARSRPAADRDILVLVQGGQKIHRAFGGKAIQLEAVSQMKLVE
jgi:hypothetical protein